MVTSQFFEIYKFCVDDGHHSSFDFQVFFFFFVILCSPIVNDHPHI